MKGIILMKLAIKILACVLATTASRVPAAEILWTHYPNPQGPGHAGMVVGDFDADGSIAVAVTAFAGPGFSISGSQLIALIGHDQEGIRTLGMTVLPMQAIVGALRSAPAEEGLARVVAVLGTVGAPSGDRIVVMGGSPLTVLRTIETPPLSGVVDVGDVDGDGDLEIVALSASPVSEFHPVVMDYATGQVEWVGPLAASDARLAQLDSDPALELILAAVPGLIVDGASHAVEWSFQAGFGESILVGHFAPDSGTSTFATYGRFRGHIEVFRGDPYASIGSFPAPSVAAAAVIAMNGADQIAIGEAEHGSVHVVDPRTGSNLFSVPNTDYGVSAVAGADLDGDTRVEIMFGAGLKGSNADVLRVVDSGTYQDELLMADEMGPHSAIARGDLSGDGSDQIAFLTTAARSNYDGPTLHVLDAATGQRLRSRTNVARRMGYPSLAAVQLDSDPQLELVVGGSTSLYPAAVHLLDGLSLSEQWQVGLYGTWIESMDVMDVDVDGHMDIVVSTYQGAIHVLDGRTGAPLRSSIPIAGTLPSLIIPFKTESNAPRVLLSQGATLRIYDLDSGSATLSRSLPVAVSAISSWGSGAACRMGALDIESNLRVLDCATLLQVEEFLFPVGTAFFRPLHPSGDRFIAAAGNYLFTVDSIGFARLGPPLGDELGRGNKGILSLMHEQGAADLVIGSRHAVARIGIGLDAIFTSGFD